MANIHCESASIDQIANEGEAAVAIVIIVLEALVGLVVCYNLIKLCRESFSYRKDGINETIEFNVVCLATIISNKTLTQPSYWPGSANSGFGNPITSPTRPFTIGSRISAIF
jgi:hypothetical protein